LFTPRARASGRDNTHTHTHENSLLTEKRKKGLTRWSTLNQREGEGRSEYFPNPRRIQKRPHMTSSASFPSSRSDSCVHPGSIFPAGCILMILQSSSKWQSHLCLSLFYFSSSLLSKLW
jgi:hypothetical protein